MEVAGKLYRRCPTCQATLLDPRHYLSADAEHAYYALHRNEFDDMAYRRFLSRLAEPLLQRLKQGATGLDFGCGPGPVLVQMFSEAGFAMRCYDPFFWPDECALQRRYDFITCTETIEHCHQPGREFDLLGSLVKPDGWLGLMTCFQTDDQRFAHWQYRRDPTHVVFYREHTFRVIAAQRNWECLVPAKDIVLMHAMV